MPKELNGSNKPSNLVYVCANCHGIIYVPESTAGQHSIKKENSIQIVQWFLSTDGMVLQYISEGEERYVVDKNS